MIVIENKKLRGFLGKFIPFFLVPLTLAAAAFLPDNKQYWLAALALALLAFVLFVSGFEKKKTGSRRLVSVSILSALAVVGRLIPFFKPVSAIVILTGMYFGPEAGFLCGASSALVSNFFFGQGPWTPFQMVAWGLIGLFSGFLSKPLEKSRVFLLLWG
ncbi:MAG: ECF transporter S component, partial [Clostridia bacterium]|nr:ECF transporter S component [Clostridia bacterium]